MPHRSEAEDDSATLVALREHSERLASAFPGVLRRIEVRSGDAVIEVEWQQVEGAAAHGPAAAPPAGAPAADAAPGETHDPDEDALTVTSPLVGTFYRAPEPGAAPFVDVGDTVEAGQTVGIVEAMKLMNHVASEERGIVVDLPVEDGTPVEFGQALVRLRPE